MKALLTAIIVALMVSVETAGAVTFSFHWRSNATRGILSTLKQQSQGVGWGGCTRRSAVLIRCSGMSSAGLVHLYLRPISRSKASMLTVVPALDIRKHSTTTKLKHWIVS